MAAPLTGSVALVTGASRGVGRGVAVGLGEAGATVYVTGRTVAEGAGPGGLPGTVQDTADQVTAAGGRGVAVPLDHTDDAAVAGLFARIRSDHGRLDVLVNNVWGGYEFFVDGTEFWLEQGFWTAPIERWDRCFAAGVRAHYVASWHAVPIMVAQHSGLIVNVSFFAAQRDDRGVSYGVAKAADDRMVATMAHELRDHGVTAVSLYPGLVRTESVLRAAEHFDLSNSESPQFLGRVVAALAADPDVQRHSGQVLVAAQVAAEYGVVDLDGTSPRPLTVDET